MRNDYTVLVRFAACDVGRDEQTYTIRETRSRPEAIRRAENVVANTTSEKAYRLATFVKATKIEAKP